VAKTVIFMFSGQGSHYFQMGKDLWESHSVFRSQMERGDAIVRPLLGRSVLDELYRHPISDSFDELIVSHSALIMVQHALFATLLSEGIKPDCVWGISAGEFAAGIATGVWSLESALAAAIEQARAVTRSCRPGGMLAVLGPPSLYQSLRVTREQTTLAGVNFDSHFVVSGPTENLESLERCLGENRISYQRLAIRFAFHSEAIDIARDSFLDFCETLPEFKLPQLTWFSGMTAQYVHTIPRSYFWDVVRQPMKFYEGMTYLEGKQSSVFVDCGPAGTLATFLKYALPPHSASTCYPTMTAFHQGTKNIQILKQRLKQTRPSRVLAERNFAVQQRY
jgi:bacillaene synthase trans-acting acyltransferase